MLYICFHTFYHYLCIVFLICHAPRFHAAAAQTRGDINARVPDVAELRITYSIILTVQALVRTRKDEETVANLLNGVGQIINFSILPKGLKAIVDKYISAPAPAVVA